MKRIRLAHLIRSPVDRPAQAAARRPPVCPALCPWLLSLTLFGPAPQAAAQGDSTVEVRQLADRAYELELKSVRSRDVGEGQIELQPTAERLCGGLPVHLGRYQFRTSKPLSASAANETAVFMLKQEVHCGAPAAVASKQPAPVPGPGKQGPSELEKALVVSLTRRYFSLVDSGDFKAAYALTSPEMQQGTSLELWIRLRADFAARAGEVQARTIRKVTWYKDPPNAQASGVFAAVDHDGSFQKLGIYCGYLMWHQQSDGSFKLFRQVDRSSDKMDEARMSAKEIAEVRKAQGC